MRAHTIAHGSRSFTGRKCVVCKLVCKPGETIVEHGFPFIVHRGCLWEWIQISYSDYPVDGKPMRLSRDAAKAARERAEQEAFDEYRDLILARMVTAQAQAANDE